MPGKMIDDSSERRFWSKMYVLRSMFSVLDRVYSAPIRMLSVLARMRSDQIRMLSVLARICSAQIRVLCSS